jgi:glycosyltransferase involved in cell wall biosynthesis
MLGPVNHPHTEHLALAMGERGFAVTVAGHTEPSLPPSVLPAAGIPAIPAPAALRRDPRGAVAHVRWIRRLCHDVRPAVVHAHWLCGYAAFAAIARATPLVAMAWGSDVFGADGVRTLANRVALRGADVAMADSQALLDRLIALGAARDSTVLVNWGVDLATFAPVNGARPAVRAELGLGPGPVILSPRSLTPVYNTETILAAFALVTRARPDAQLVVKHMGVDDATLPDVADARVHVVGHVPHERMARYFQAADVCVSIPSSDSSPRSVWEAMACGCPVVVSDLPWVHELIAAERDALVVPIDAAAVAAALARVIADPELARRLAGRGRALAEAHRDRATEMDRLAAVYRSLSACRR